MTIDCLLDCVTVCPLSDGVTICLVVSLCGFVGGEHLHWSGTSTTTSALSSVIETGLVLLPLDNCVHKCTESQLCPNKSQIPTAWKSTEML